MPVRLTVTARWFFVATMATIEGAKDTAFYPYPDFVNPNTNYKMYWKDARNVLDDLEQFDALYIRYHRCVWSEYHNPEGDNNDGDGGEDDYWYVGAQTNYRANAAFSLYGTLKHEKDKGCARTSFINSFFTVGGVETLAYPLGFKTNNANSYCASNGNSNDRRTVRRFLEEADEEDDVDDERDDGDRDNGEKDDDIYEYEDINYGDDDAYVSIGTGCSSRGTFVLDEFYGGQCFSGSLYKGTRDALEIFNSNMEGIQCTKIYSSSDFDDDEDSVVYSILSQSSACSVRMYSKRCPDPFGRVKKYESNFDKAIYLAKRGQPYTVRRHSIISYLMLPFLIAGTLFVISSFLFVKSVRQNQQKGQTGDKRFGTTSRVTKVTSPKVLPTRSSSSPPAIPLPPNPTFSFFNRKIHPTRSSSSPPVQSTLTTPVDVNYLSLWIYYQKQNGLNISGHSRTC